MTCQAASKGNEEGVRKLMNEAIPAHHLRITVMIALLAMLLLALVVVVESALGERREGGAVGPGPVET